MELWIGRRGFAELKTLHCTIEGAYTNNFNANEWRSDALEPLSLHEHRWMQILPLECKVTNKQCIHIRLLQQWRDTRSGSIITLGLSHHSSLQRAETNRLWMFAGSDYRISPRKVCRKWQKKLIFLILLRKKKGELDKHLRPPCDAMKAPDTSLTPCCVNKLKQSIS